MDVREAGSAPAPPRAALEKKILEETRTYLRDLADLSTLGMAGARQEGPVVVWTQRPPSLLQELLADRLRGQVDLIFGLLAVLYDARDMAAARRGLLSGHATERNHALEYLDNTLRSEAGRVVMVALGDATQRERMERARHSFGVAPESVEATLRRRIETRTGGDGESDWIAAAALHAVHALGVTALHDVVRRCADSSVDPLVRETAAWVVARIEGEVA